MEGSVNVYTDDPKYYYEQGTTFGPVHRHESSILQPECSLNNAESVARRHNSAENRPVYRNVMRRKVSTLRHGQMCEGNAKLYPCLMHPTP